MFDGEVDPELEDEYAQVFIDEFNTLLDALVLKGSTLTETQQKLQDLLDKVDGLDSTKYTEESWKALQEERELFDDKVDPELEDEYAQVFIDEFNALLDALVLKGSTLTETQQKLQDLLDNYRKDRKTVG